MFSHFIAIEGLDGCGKSTQVRLLAEDLRERGMSVVTVRNPGGTRAAEKIRKVAFGAIGADRHPKATCHLMTAAAILAANQVVYPALVAEEVVVTDRDIYASGPIYCGCAGETDAERASLAGYSARLLEFAGLQKPDLTILLDVPEDVALERKGQERDSMNRFDASDRETAARRRQAYLRMAHVDGGRRWAVVDATAKEEVVAERVLAAAANGKHRDPARWPSPPPGAGWWVTGVVE